MVRSDIRMYNLLFDMDMALFNNRIIKCPDAECNYEFRIQPEHFRYVAGQLEWLELAMYSVTHAESPEFPPIQRISLRGRQNNDIILYRNIRCPKCNSKCSMDITRDMFTYWEYLLGNEQVDNKVDISKYIQYYNEGVL